MNSSQHSMKPTIGVLGGMGPRATLCFYQYLLDLTPAIRDQDHLNVCIVIRPGIPDRTAAILGNGKDPTRDLLSGLKVLEKAGADMAVVTCNTAHYFLQKIKHH